MEFRVLALGDPTELTGLYYELNGKSVLVSPSDVNFSSLYQKPKTGRLVLFREIAPIPPETKPKRVTVLSIGLGDKSPSLLVLKSGASGTVAGMVVDDAWDVFPAQMVRVLSFSKRKIAAQVEEVNAEILPGSSHLFPYATAKPRIRIKVASLDESLWKMRFNNSQAIIPGARVNMVVTDFEPTSEDPNPDGVKVLKMIDPLLPPKLE